MKLIFFSIIAFSMIGLIFPSGFSSTYVHETGYPFSIQYPSDWYIFEFPEDEGGGVSIDPDRTGRNGFYINLPYNILVVGISLNLMMKLVALV